MIGLRTCREEEEENTNSYSLVGDLSVCNPGMTDLAGWSGIEVEGVNGVRDFKGVIGDEVGSNILKKSLCAIVMATVWSLWLERNNRLFNYKRILVGVVEKIKVTTFF
ncbi:hypothetical protein QVD17_36602 [Tagetes erecta]|uniref:Uncharacterized protein n=1 Tax=Tagetes erecta TaxID=13708 RepID=A0AAD8JV45_TARER|nr:hypothetical protein QVD17_36602 [Tagetes erecta]